MKKDYYQILNLNRKASPEEIRQQYRELALEHHPDVSMHENAHAHFVEINEAYHVLGDPEKKTKYDLLYDQYLSREESKPAGDVRPAGTGQRAGAGQHAGVGQQETEFHEYAAHARTEAHQSAKTRYQEFLKHADCFFSDGRKADGQPYYYAMHVTTGIAGGTGPMGSIKGRAVLIPVPRSKHAMIMHRLGFAIKFTLFALVAAGLRFGFMDAAGYPVRLLLAVACIGAGGLAVRGIYHASAVRSKQHADNYFLVVKYKNKGYARGFHPVISNTPLGILAYVMRYVL